MMQKTHSWPDGHWSWPIQVNHKHGVRCGPMIWVGGQVDLDAKGNVRTPGDLDAQTVNAMAYFEQVLDDLDCDLGDLVSLLCFYVNDGSVDEAVFLESVARCLPRGCRTTVTAVPVPYLAYDGLMVEIEGCAMRRENGQSTERRIAHCADSTFLPSPFVEGLQSDSMIFVSGQYPVDGEGQVACAGDVSGQTQVVASRISKILEELGADFDDVVKSNRWYAGVAGIEDFEAAALMFARNFKEPGPAATGVPIPRHADGSVMIKIAVIAMRALDGSYLERMHSWPAGLWDWHVHLPYKHGVLCDGMIFVGGQVSLDSSGRAVNPDDLGAQTHQAMRHIGAILEDLGAHYDDVCKIMTVYKGSCGARDLHTNLPIRSSYFPSAGPATTGVPLPDLAYESMVVEIDAYAMTDVLKRKRQSR